MGKDIGGKLMLIEIYLRLGIQSDYIVFLHDKKSLHSSTGSFWKNELFRIIDEKTVDKIMLIFQNQNSTGIIGPSKFIRNEWNSKGNYFSTTNSDILLTLLDSYRFKIRDYSFVAGTMFWVRSEIFQQFFLENSISKIRESLEKGNVMDSEKGSITHSWERMLSWIAIEKGYKLFGIR